MIEPHQNSPGDRLQAALREVEPALLDGVAEAERERRLPAPVADRLRDAGFFRLFRPVSRGGFGLSPVEEFRIAESLARIDSAAAWNVQVCNASELFGGWFSDEVSAEVFGSPGAVVCGSFNPHRRAVPVEGGYLVSGRTPFNSNCHNATWVIGLADVWQEDSPRLDPSGEPETLLTVFPSSSVEIVDNWNTLGMCGTGSHDLDAVDVFVPTERAVSFGPLVDPSQAYDSPLYRMAIWATVGCHASVALGIAQAAIDDLADLGARVPAYTQNALRDRQTAQLRLAKAQGKLAAARSFFYEVFDQAWSKAQSEGALDMAEKARCQLAGSMAVMTGAEVVDLVHSCVGTAGIRNEERFQKYFRDAHVITQHAFVSEARLESVGQIAFGLEPSWGFFGF